MKLYISLLFSLILLVGSFANCNCQISEIGDAIEDDPIPRLKLNLNECLELAKKNNRFYPVADYGIKIAEAQYRQATSAYWPNLSLDAHYVHMDRNPMMVNAPATFDLGGFSFDLPAQRITLMDNDLFEGTIELMYPIYTGGKISSIIRQAEQGLEIAKHTARKTDIEVIANVKRMYYSVLVSKILYETSNDAFIKIEVTNQITEKMFEGGSGTVLKTDYLKSKMMTQTVSSIVRSLKYNALMALTGLKNSLGLSPDSAIDIADDELPIFENNLDETRLLEAMYKNHPDWNIVTKGLEALDAKIDEARSDIIPKVAFFANYIRKLNSYDYGMVSPDYTSNWNLGLALQMPIFNGFLTYNRIDEARARYLQLSEQQKLLENGLTSKLNVAVLRVQSAYEQLQDSKSALETAIENRDLNERAYEADLVEAQDMLMAQIMEAIINAKYQMGLYDMQLALIDLETLIGSDINTFQE